MNRKILCAFSLLFYICLPKYCLGSEPENLDRYLIVGRPASIKLIKLSENTDAAVSPAYYKATIKDVEVIYGGEKVFPRTVTVIIRATNSYAFLKYDRISMLVNAEDVKKPEVIFWRQVSSISCLPKEIIAPEYSQYFFENKWGEDKLACMFIRGRVQPETVTDPLK